MVDCLRFFRLGIINLMGITVPGLLILSILIFGFILPVSTVLFPFGEILLGSPQNVLWDAAAELYSADKGIIATLAFFLLLVLAYIVGYIIRLSTPDELDKISADKVIAKMDQESREGCGETAEKDHWPYRGEPNNKYPYFHFRDYLASRGLLQLADIVKWGSSVDEGGGKRTKTLVNMMKLEVIAENPELSTMIEANEAHVRLMFGTWLAIKTCRPLVIAGVIVVSLGLCTRVVLSSMGLPYPNPPYMFCIALGLVLLLGMWWARRRIENLFHYQRVRELMYIVGCTYYTGLLRNSQHAASQLTKDTPCRQ